MRAAIGIDIGGTNIQVALISKPGEILRKEQLSVHALATDKLLLESLRQVIENLQQFSVNMELEGIGVGSPGANIKLGMIEKASNLPWDRLPIVDFLKEAFQLPVHLTNDANLFAIGEKVFGQATNLNDFVVVTLGTGVGAGIYCGGTLLLGRDGLAGEVGHVVIEKNGRPCFCGRQGCLERYTSANGLVLTTKELLSDHPTVQSTLKAAEEKELTATKVLQAAIEDDPIALAAFRNTGEVLGRALTDLAAYLNPEAIFLAGGLSRAGEFLFRPTVNSFRENLLNIYPEEIPVLPGSIPDDQAGILGAAALVWDTRGQLNKIKSSECEI